MIMMMVVTVIMGIIEKNVEGDDGDDDGVSNNDYDNGGDGRRNDIKLKQTDSKYLEMYGYIQDMLFVVGKSPVFNLQAP